MCLCMSDVVGLFSLVDFVTGCANQAVNGNGLTELW